MNEGINNSQLKRLKKGLNTELDVSPDKIQISAQQNQLCTEDEEFEMYNSSDTSSLSEELSPEEALQYSKSVHEELLLKLMENSDLPRSEIIPYMREGCITLAKTNLKPPENCKLNDYQYIGVKWLLILHDIGCSGILADEMGLGKTAQTASFLGHLHMQGKLEHPCVVACPATLKVGTWAPSLKVLKYHGPQKSRLQFVRQFEESLKNSNKTIHVLITSHQTLTSAWDRSLIFKRHSFSYLVIDEAHNLKNAESQLYKSVNRMIQSGCRRLFITGTPIQNELVELLNLFVLLIPQEIIKTDIFLKAFNFCQAQDETLNLSGINFLRQVFGPFIMRRLKSDVMKDLPTKISVVERCTIHGRQRNLYLNEIRSRQTEFSRALTLLAMKKTSSQSNSLLSHVKSLNLSSTDKSATTPTEENRLPSESSAIDTVSSIDDSNAMNQDTFSAKQFLHNLVFRLRRICNHPLLYRGYYSANARKAIAKFLETTEEFKNQSLEKILMEINTWSDFEIHQTACYYEKLNHFKVPSQEFLNSAKVCRMLELVQQVYAENKKALIFSQFTTFLDVIQETILLHLPHISMIRLDGSTAVNERHDLVTQFGMQENSDKHITLFLLSTKAGGFGLNLTAATTVILMDQDWNPHNDKQAEDRVHRLGQTESVTVYRLCCRDTLEESILKAAEKKLRLDEAFGGSAELLTASVLKDCFESGLAIAADEAEEFCVFDCSVEENFVKKKVDNCSGSNNSVGSWDNDLPKTRKGTRIKQQSKPKVPEVPKKPNAKGKSPREKKSSKLEYRQSTLPVVKKIKLSK